MQSPPRLTLPDAWSLAARVRGLADHGLLLRSTLADEIANESRHRVMGPRQSEWKPQLRSAAPRGGSIHQFLRRTTARLVHSWSTKKVLQVMNYITLSRSHVAYVGYGAVFRQCIIAEPAKLYWAGMPRAPDGRFMLNRYLWRVGCENGRFLVDIQRFLSTVMH
jgi:hypothetical protein